MNFVLGKLGGEGAMQFTEQADGGVALGLPERLAKRLASLPERRLCWVFSRRMCAWPKTVPASR